MATIFMVGCPEPTKDKGRATPPTIEELLSRLATYVDMPEKTDDEKVKKQNKIQSIYALIKKTDPKYKPKDKDELATFIKAEIWAQGEKGKQNWEADLNSIDTSLVTDMSYLFSDNKDEGYGLHEYNGLPPLWTPNNPTTTVDMYKGSKSPIPTWHSIGELKTAVEKTPPSQADIKALINKITKGNPDYKHRPKNKDELVTIIKAEIWAQGEDGKQNWEADLNNIDTSLVKNMSYLFSDDEKNGHGLSAFNGKIDKWDVSEVTTMRCMFYKAKAFNQPLNEWNVSKVTTMRAMFDEAIAFDQPLNKWDVSSVTNMQSMFWKAKVFNQPLDKWDVSSVTNMQTMFYGAEKFNGKLNGWGEKVSKVTTMYGMFWGAKAFNQPLNEWNVSKVTTMRDMFIKALVFNQPLNKWDVSSVTTMQEMFYEAKAFNQPLNEWNVSNVKNMRSMFYDAIAFDQPLNKWDVGSVENMHAMFWGAEKFNQPLNEWDVSSVTTMSYMLAATEKFDQPLNKWDVSKVTDMSRMFSRAYVFNQPLNEWDVSSVKTMFYMFCLAVAFNQPLNEWDKHFKKDDKYKKINVIDMFRDSGVKKLPAWYKAIKK